MKKIFCFIFLFSWLFCSNVLAKEEILSFHSDIFVEKDGSLIIEEKIQVRAEGKSIKRGIYRDLPFYYAKEKTPLEVKSVLRDGQIIPYSFGDVKSHSKRIYMGDMDEKIQPGIYEYKILYTYQNVIRKNFLKTEDVLRLNLIGTEWSFPILNATAKIHLPKGLELAYHPTVYAGKRGSKVESASVKIYPEMIEVESSGKLHPNEGITIDVRFKKGVLTIPIFTTVQKINLLFYGVIVFGFIAICVYAYLSWKKYGKDAVAKPIYPRFDVPKEVGIGALVRLLYHNKPTNETRMTLISAHFADLLQKGFIKIYTDPNGKWIEIKKVENIYPKTPEEEFFVLNAEDVYFLCVEKRHKKFAEYVSDYGDFATEQSEVLVKRNEEKIKDFFFMVCKFCGLIILMVTVLNFFRAANFDQVLYVYIHGFMFAMFGFMFALPGFAFATVSCKYSGLSILFILGVFSLLYFLFLKPEEQVFYGKLLDHQAIYQLYMQLVFLHFQ